MHIMKRVLPYLAVQALRGRTWAGENVFDSPSDIGTIRITGKDKAPFIAVYCDEWDMKSAGVPDEMDAQTPGAFKLIIEVGAAQRMNVDNEDEGTQIAATDEGLEWQNALISRQAITVLTRPGNIYPWANLFLGFVGGKILQYAIRRGGPPNDGQRPAPRYASTVSIIKVSTVCGEPELGQTVSMETYPLWQTLLDMMTRTSAPGAGDDLDAGLAKLLRAHFDPASGVDISEAVEASSKLWLDASTVAAIGLAPFEHTGYSPDQSPSAEPVRPDVPIDEVDMATWLAAQGPDEAQGPPNGG